MFKLILVSLSLSYLWFIYYNLYFSRRQIFENYSEPVSIIVPIYNEPAGSLISCIESLIKSKREEDELILVDNNSTLKECIDTLKRYSKILPVYLEKRQGKRYAHSCGLKHATNEIVVFCDSDTVFDKNAITQLVKPFQDKTVGGVTGEMQLTNYNHNIITRSIDAMFWTASNIFRKSTANIGLMQVMPGAISAYRKEDLLKLEYDYLNQKFFGRLCNISDDRYICMRIQTRFNRRIIYNPKALALTEMPTTFKGFWKTLERWKRGATREVFTLWKEKNIFKKTLFYDVQFNFFMFNIMMVLKITLIFHLIIHFQFINLIMVVGWIILMSSMWALSMIFENPREYPYKLLYVFLYEFFWSFSYFNALWNIKRQGKWVTR